GAAQPPPQGGYLSACSVRIEDVFFKLGTHVGALNLARCVSVDLRGIYISGPGTGSTAPTDSGQVGIVLPYELNDGAHSNILDEIKIVGVYTGMQVSEHTHIRKAEFDFCVDAMQLLESQHAILIDRMVVQKCIN